MVWLFSQMRIEIMWDWIAGITAFALYFLYDWNRIYLKTGWMNSFFFTGCLLLAAVGLHLVYGGFTSGVRLWLFPAVLCLAGLIHTLFFALPFDDTYCREADRHKVCRSGAYGLCRHPGIWWFFGCFCCLGLSCAQMERLLLGLCLSLLNLGYAWYQDRLIFIHEFSDYDDYRKTVPFLIPRIRKEDEKDNDI